MTLWHLVYRGARRGASSVREVCRGCGGRSTLAFSDVPGPPRPLKVIKHGHSTCQDRGPVGTLDGELAYHYGRPVQACTETVRRFGGDHPANV